MTKVINFYAGPGEGKSTSAAGLFYVMKQANIAVELVTEYAKECVWNGNEEVLSNQLYVTAHQAQRQLCLQGKVDYIITDSPIMLGVQYASEEDKGLMQQVCNHWYSKFDNINVFVDRTKPYFSEGRLQSLEEAQLIDNYLKCALNGECWGGIQHTITSTGSVEVLMADIVG